MAYTPEVDDCSVYEFPLSGECVDRTIEIGSSGEEVPGSSSTDSEEVVFPSDDEEYADPGDSSGHDGIVYPSDLKYEDMSSTMTAGTASTSSTNASAFQDIQSELTDVGATLVSGCCQQQCLLSLTPKVVLASRRKRNSLTSNAKRQ